MEKQTSSACEATLLHYLQPHAQGERLTLSLPESDDAAVQRSYPFRLLDDSAPYCRVLQGAVVTDAGTVLKTVALQLQKEQYPPPSDPLRPVTNRDIDRAWQEAYAAHLDEKDAVLLSSQTDQEGRFVQQAPLFYCRERNEFFHPVCPSCGLPLSLCRDDDFLKRKGLLPYSTTLKRYLYCRACCQLGLQEIYLFERDHGDPLTIKDRWSLIEHLGAVGETLDPEGGLPCARCAEREGCFGQGHLARTRMIPFSFYPFHMLLRSAPSLHASDFLACLAGALPDELQQPQAPELQGREEGTLFRRDDTRSFLEILFLKLSFLHDVLRQACSGRGEAARVSMERIWVTLAPLSGRLPLFWNFRVSIFDSIVPPFPTRCTESSAHLGLVWFRTLVSSRYVTDPDLLHAVVDHLALADEGVREIPWGRLAELLVPENIFWEPEGREFPGEWLSMWEKASSLGVGLLDAVRPTAPRELLGQLAALLPELKGAILAAPAAPEVPRRPPGDEEVLRGVVARLIGRYTRLDECQGGAATEEFEAATLIIPSRHDQAEAPTAPEETLLETVVIPHAPKQSAPPEAEWDEPFLETVILSPRAVPGGHPPRKNGTPEAQGGADLLETVVVASPRPRDKQE